MLPSALYPGNFVIALMLVSVCLNAQDQHGGGHQKPDQCQVYAVSTPNPDFPVIKDWKPVEVAAPTAQLTIYQDGNVKSVRLIRSSNVSDWDQVFLNAVKHWTFSKTPNCGLRKTRVSVDIDVARADLSNSFLANADASGGASQVRIRTSPSSDTPTKKFQVTPPASFRADQLPAHGLIEFKVSGTVGQILLVQLSNTKLFLKALREPGNARLASAGDSGNRLYMFPRTGVYRFLLDLGGDQSNVRFSFLTANNSMIDPKIAPGQISVNFGAFAPGGKLSVMPYQLNGEEDYLNSWPAHLAAEHDGFEFRIMSVSSYNAVFRDDHDDRMGSLGAALQADGAHAEPGKFPYPVYLGGFINTFAKVSFLKGKHWQGLRWIGGFGQDVSCNPDLGYVSEGLSDDGRYFVLIRAKITNLAKRKWAQDCAASGENGTKDLERNINSAEGKTFNPPLDKLDAVVKSLVLQP